MVHEHSFKYQGARNHKDTKKKLEVIEVSSRVSALEPPGEEIFKDQESKGVIWFDNQAGVLEEMERKSRTVAEGPGGVQIETVTRESAKLN